MQFEFQQIRILNHSINHYTQNSGLSLRITDHSCQLCYPNIEEPSLQFQNFWN